MEIHSEKLQQDVMDYAYGPVFCNTKFCHMIEIVQPMDIKNIKLIQSQNEKEKTFLRILKRQINYSTYIKIYK